MRTPAMKPDSIWLISVFCFAVSLPCAAQARGVPRDPVQQLESSDWVQRAHAFDSLRREPGALARPSMPDVLRRLLERENDVIVSALRDPNSSTRGVSSKYGEAFGEYYAEVLGACNKYCDKQDPRTLEALVSGAYSPSSPFALELAEKYGPQVLAVLIRKSNSDVAELRHEAVEMLARIAKVNRSLTAEQNAQVHSAVVLATADSLSAIRKVAVRALGNIGEAGDLALLRRISEQDSVTRVREEALRAIRKIPKH